MSLINFNFQNIASSIKPSKIEPQKNKKAEFKPEEIKDKFVCSCNLKDKKTDFKCCGEEDRIVLQGTEPNKIRKGRIVACAGGGSN